MNAALCELGCLMLAEEKDLAALHKLLQRSTASGDAVRFKAGQVLFYQDHLPVGCFLLQRGKVKVGAKTCEASVVGLFHLLNNTPLCASVVAQSDVEAIFFPQPLVMSLLSSWRQ